MSILGIAGIIGGLALAVAAGIVIAKIVMLAFSWLKNKIKHKLAKRNVSKVAVGELSEIIKNCKNEISLSALEELETIQKEGITHFCAELQSDGSIRQDGVEVWDVNREETEVRNLINETGEGMVVVKA